jgi:uncharacterized OsmC-like protein
VEKTFDVQFSFRGEAVGKMRNEVRVTAEAPASNGVFDIPTDEGASMGGDATAPTPLHYFTAALAGCFMTQMRFWAPQQGVQLDGLVVQGRTDFLGRRSGREPYVTEPVGFELEVHVDSPASGDAVLALVEVAKGSCFVEQTLAKGVEVRHRVHHAGRVTDAEAA